MIDLISLLLRAPLKLQIFYKMIMLLDNIENLII